MNRSEAETVARVIGSADGGCISCVRSLCEEMNIANLGWTFEPSGETSTDSRPDIDYPDDEDMAITTRRVIVNVSEAT